MRVGLKPANRITVSRDESGDVEARLSRDGFAVVRGPEEVGFPGRPSSVILYAAPRGDRARALALAEAEAPLLPPGGPLLSADEAAPLHARLGELLGFPPCCVDAFVARLRRGVNRRTGGGDAHEDFVAAEDAARASTAFLGRLNDLSPDRRARLVTFYPCRYDCPAAAGYAAKLFAAAERFSPREAAALGASLLGTFSIHLDGRRGGDPAGGAEPLTVSFAGF